MADILQQLLLFIVIACFVFMGYFAVFKPVSKKELQTRLEKLEKEVQDLKSKNNVND